MRFLKYILLFVSLSVYAQTSLLTSDLTVVSGTNTYTADHIPDIATTRGATIRVRFTNANTGASTFSLDGATAKDLVQSDGTALNSGDIKAGDLRILVYDHVADKWKISSGSGSSGLIVGTTSIASGTNTRIFFDNSGILGEYTISGTGNVAMTNSPSFTTPSLGSASASGLSVSGLTASRAVFTDGSKNLSSSLGTSNDLVLGSGSLLSGTTNGQVVRMFSGSLSMGNILPSSITVPGATILGNTAATAGTADAVSLGTGLSISGGQLNVNPAVGSITGLGTGVSTALGIDIGLSGSFITNGGALGTPSSGIATNLTGLPISTGLTGGASNRVPYFTSSTALSVSGAPIFDGTNFGIGVIPQSLLTVSRQSSIQAPVSGSTAQYIGLDANPLRITYDTHNNSSASGTAFMVRRSRGTSASPSALSSGDVIAAFSGRGYGTTQYAAASTGLINIKANQTFTDSNNGTYISFDATPDNSVTAAEVFRFGGSGQLGIGGANFGTSGNTIISGGSGSAVSWGQYAQSNLSGLGTGVSTWLGTPSWTNFNSAITGTAPYWALTGTSTLTGSTTITSNTASQLNFNGTFTATANNQYLGQFGGSPTSRNTASDAFNAYVFNPTVTQNAGNPSGQTLRGVYIAPTFSVAGTPSTPSLEVKSGSTAANSYAFQATSNGGTSIFRILENAQIQLGGGGLSYFAGTSNGVSASTSGNLFTFVGNGSVFANNIPLLTVGASSNITGAVNQNTYVLGVGAAGNLSYAPSTGTGQKFTYLIGKHTINTTGSYTGDINFIEYDPTLTSTTGVSKHLFAKAVSGSIEIQGSSTLNSFGGSSPVNTLESGGSFGANIRTITSSTTLTSTDYTILCDATSGNITITLPAASGATRRIYKIIKTDATANTVSFSNVTGTTTINTQWYGKEVQSNGTNYYITATINP